MRETRGNRSRRAVGAATAVVVCAAVVILARSAGAQLATEGEIVLTTDLDSNNASAPRWTSVVFTPEETGEFVLELAWTGSADVAMDVRRADDFTWLAAAASATPSPKSLSIDLDAGTGYLFAVWSRSGTTTAELTVFGEAPPPTTTTTTTTTSTTTTTVPSGGELLLATDLDATQATAPRWTSTSYTPTASGPILFELSWQGSADVAMDLRRAADFSWVAANVSSNPSPKTMSADLDAGTTYLVAVWARSGAASAELRAFGDGPPPTTTTTSTTTVPPTTTTTTTTTPPPTGAPNIVIINVDDARVEALEVLPKTRAWFGDDGTTFTNAYVSTPSCCPSRATLMTGQYVHNNGQIDQDTPLTDEGDSIQRWLSDAGYFTSHSGKYLHWLPLSTVAPHWDRWTYFKGGYNNVWTNFDGVIQQSSTYSTVMTFDSAIEHAEHFESLDDDRPFFLHITPVAPHKPYDPEPQYANAPVPPWNPSPSVGEADRSDKPPWVSYMTRTPAQGAADREASMRLMMSVDDQVDRLMTRLTELGEADNTIAIFTSDNGYFWAEHGRNSKFLPYNEAVEVPFLLRWPGQVAAGATSTDLVSHVDILPTVLTAAGVTPGHVVDGRDILDPQFERLNLLTEYWEDPANGNFVPDWSSIRNESRVYTEYYDQNGSVVAREYYDLITDPWELVNLLGDGNSSNDPDTTAVAADLALYRTCAGATCQ